MSELRPARRPAPPPWLSRRGALWLWAVAGVGLVAVNLLAVPLARAMAGLNPQLQSLIYNLIYYLGFVALPLALLARRRPGLWRAFRPGPLSLFSTLSVVTLALLGVFFFTDVSALWAILLEALHLPLQGAAIPLPDGAPGLALCVLYIAVLPALCEEFLFRGAMLPALERYGTRRAIFATAALFALLHGSLAGLPVQFLIGAILADLVICCDSIYAGLIYHTTHNAATVLLQYALGRSAAAAEAEASASMLSAAGGLSGVLQLLLELLLLGAMMGISLRMFRTTARLRGVTPQPPRPQRLRAREWLPLVVGLACAALLYGVDLWLGLTQGGAA